MKTQNPLLAKLRYHVTGAIERGEGVAIVEQRAQPTAHTPGPWICAGPGQVFDQYGNEIVLCKHYGAGIIPAGYVAPWHSYKANARLIASAPELLAALENIASIADDMATDSEKQKELKRVGMLTLARAAILKAKGVQ